MISPEEVGDSMLVDNVFQDSSNTSELSSLPCTEVSRGEEGAPAYAETQHPSQFGLGLANFPPAGARKMRSVSFHVFE